MGTVLSVIAASLIGTVVGIFVSVILGIIAFSLALSLYWLTPGTAEYNEVVGAGLLFALAAAFADGLTILQQASGLQPEELAAGLAVGAFDGAAIGITYGILASS